VAVEALLDGFLTVEVGEDLIKLFLDRRDARLERLHATLKHFNARGDGLGLILERSVLRGERVGLVNKCSGLCLECVDARSERVDERGERFDARG
jgi:hypothetical protein